ncbi:MAG: FmdE family protein [Oscillospiraceae bacterium]|nr:FmdE family protein [Oscillospiraceae bacterium]
MTEQYRADLKKAAEFHGHTCTGIILGVRLARVGLNYLGIDDPAKNRDFIVYCEIDRCLTDAVQSVTGCSLGKRRLKAKEYSKMAATFVDMNTKNGTRSVMSAKENAPEGADELAFWNQFTDEEVFRFEPVTVDIPPEDMPGRPIRSVVCEMCHEKIMDNKDVQKDGKILCRSCAEGGYYQKI